MITFLSQSNNVRLGEVINPPAWLRNKNNKMLRKYNSQLFCKWNEIYQLWEIWEKGISGQEYKVTTCKTEDGRYREIDLSDIEDIHSRSIINNSKNGIFTEVISENFSLDRELELEHEQQNMVKDISVETFNGVMENPVIGGFLGGN